MRFDHKVILAGCYSVIPCSSYYSSEPFRRTQSNKTAVKGDQIAVVNISGVKSKEGKELLELRSSVDAGTYGYSLSADKFQLEIRRQFSNSEIRKLHSTPSSGDKQSSLIVRSCLRSLLLHVIFCLNLETKDTLSSLVHTALEYRFLMKSSI